MLSLEVFRLVASIAVVVGLPACVVSFDATLIGDDSSTAPNNDSQRGDTRPSDSKQPDALPPDAPPPPPDGFPPPEGPPPDAPLPPDVAVDAPPPDAPPPDVAVDSCSIKTHLFVPIADAMVSADSPYKNFGNDPTLEVDQLPDLEVLLKFDIKGLSGYVHQATLRLHVLDGTVDGPALYPTSNAWLEMWVTWNNKPAPATTSILDLGAVKTGWVDIDLGEPGSGTPATDEVVSVNFVATSDDGLVFESRESAHPPQLLVETSSCP